MVLPIKIICVVVWGIVWWLVLATSFACSTIISLSEGAVGQCSP